MEMNVSTQEEQVVAKKVGGLNPAVVLPILYVIALGIYIFILGNPGNFKNEGVTGLSVAFSDVENKDLHPDSFMGIIYMGGPIVHILILFMITVIVKLDTALNITDVVSWGIMYAQSPPI